MKAASKRKIELGLCGREDDYDFRIPTNTQEIFQLKAVLAHIRGKMLKNSIRKIEWVNKQKHDWQEKVLLVFGKQYDVITFTKFCHPQIFFLFTHFLKQDANKEIKYFLSEEILHQDKQWATLLSFFAKTSFLSQGEDFELNASAYLSRISVASIWVISLFFSKVIYLITSKMYLH
jgi:hypothetical protein